MCRSKLVIVTASFALFAGLAFAVPAPAHAATCPYGGDESQSMRCFDCMKRVWTGKRWKLKNTCKPRTFDDFNSGSDKAR